MARQHCVSAGCHSPGVRSRHLSPWPWRIHAEACSQSRLESRLPPFARLRRAEIQFKRGPMKFYFLVMAVLLTSSIHAGPEHEILRGEWVATAGSTQSLRGRWIGQALPSEPNVMQGSWTLMGGNGEVLLTGTWSARRTALGWQGTWSAQDRYRRRLSGSWKSGETNTGGKSLEKLFERTFERQISGSWRSGRQQGQWWLKGSPPPAGNP